jgi:uncharacterized protein (TIGR00290 family)
MSKREKVLVAWSSGKDSALSLYQVKLAGRYEIVSLLTTITEDYDRVSMHGVSRVLVEQQANSLGLPLAKVLIPRDSSNVIYESKMEEVLRGFQQSGVTGVVFGDIFLEGIREYRENNLSRVGMKGVFPLWGKDTGELTESFISLGFQAITTCIDTRVMDKNFLGRVMDEDFFTGLPAGVDPGGENGEFHSFVFAGPIFREKVAYTVGERVIKDSFHFCDLLPDSTTRQE